MLNHRTLILELFGLHLIKDFFSPFQLHYQIELKTAPADFRFPTTNQTRHCFTRYIEFHRCVAAKGEESGDCGMFAKYYRSLCPGEWVEKWNEQRENGTFPGPL
ncbi:cytochrome c oxidase subunit 6b-2-like isoform X1 [Olea europaea var. sylvestris]|uniref:Cytochrome c oxidase subunit 6b-2 n=1 Tax=Olea europaea subsp. europaea TaxID=158383 RepID=A0A8S0R318_OLEEU|nr:cytochrome c oxidase subunit 6b-2-like isoform X1 [Olea europaea var. sylvestris]CAA2973292.1 cytochrome c oxidase subunit 6b-2 [Olea europaea subsp. europaea]